jgi:hypothetical protein
MDEQRNAHFNELVSHFENESGAWKDAANVCDRIAAGDSSLTAEALQLLSAVYRERAELNQLLLQKARDGSAAT